eukprot:TRINITY_DN2124_c0_g1_i2.p1 TRINITY_DN2124_c0_g1~~TRINITY_DN2124_c0_g1_i2.p1  ORF type:complete len:482 (+),score=62.14 TRINITY_DN2124_c0_g1_i2:117-1448(+)
MAGSSDAATADATMTLVLKTSEDTAPSSSPPTSKSPSTSLFSTTSNLVLAVLGAGQLTLPFFFAEVGFACGIFFLFYFAFLGMHSLHVLAVHQQRYGANDYAELAVVSIGERGRLLCRGIVGIYAWGGGISFLIIQKRELDFLAHVAHLNVPGNVLMVITAIGFIWPMSSRTNLAFMKRFSPFGCIAALMVTMTVLLIAPWNGDLPLGVEICGGPSGDEAAGGRAHMWPRSFVNFAAALPLVAFALNSSWGFIPILKTMRARTPARDAAVIFCAKGVIVFSYFLISTYGYATFCDTVETSILDSLPGTPGGKYTAHGAQKALMILVRGAVALQLTLALPLRFSVARDSVARDLGLSQRVCVAACIVGSAAGLAALPLSLKVVLSITSSICASLIIYILPAILDFKSDVPGFGRRCVSVASFITGFFIMAGGLGGTIFGLAAGS